MTLDPVHVSIGVAAASLLFVPFAKSWWNDYQEGRKAKAAAALFEVLKGYAKTEDLEMNYEAIRDHQEAMHRQNMDTQAEFLKTIRLDLAEIKGDGQRREGVLTGRIEAHASQTQTDVRALRTEIVEVHRRVDSLATLTGDRRRT